MFFQFQTHVVKESEVADHCCTFALSDRTKDYTSSCSHLHQNSCSQCEELDTVLECLMEVSKTINYDNDDQRDDTMYTISEVNDCFMYAKCQSCSGMEKHILRSVNQDMARKSVLENLKEDEMLTAPQDAETSNAVLGNSLEIFHQVNPSLTTAYIRSDNAGCFHGATSVCAMPFLSSIVHCKRMDFADPQGGKSICDRKAAHVKSYIRRYVNEGNDVCTAVDFKNALMKSNIKKVSVIVALQPSKSDSKKKEPAVFKLPKITTVNNFSFKNGGVQVWRQFEIGQGCHIPAVDTTTTRDLPELTIIDTFLNQQTETEVRQSGIIEAEVPLQEPVTQVNENEVEPLVNDNTVTMGDQSNDDVDSVSKKKCLNYFHVMNVLKHLANMKFDPEEVSQDMRMVRTTNGRKRFSQEEFLSATQIASYFSRIVLNKRKLYNPLYTADDEQAETAEAEFIELNLAAA
ncbi:unnamed protein product [Mytilus coruscus]|uniref:Uncharacterized protein n=1 Tax=Mytilus coruscus TaxID=42192 RepID=A0A6J8CHL1_MYTCO|nr:unnamed protein product [Mytilus coruscus]